VEAEQAATAAKQADVREASNTEAPHVNEEVGNKQPPILHVQPELQGSQAGTHNNNNNSPHGGAPLRTPPMVSNLDNGASHSFAINGNRRKPTKPKLDYSLTREDWLRQPAILSSSASESSDSSESSSSSEAEEEEPPHQETTMQPAGNRRASQVGTKLDQSLQDVEGHKKWNHGNYTQGEVLHGPWPVAPSAEDLMSFLEVSNDKKPEINIPRPEAMSIFHKEEAGHTHETWPFGDLKENRRCCHCGEVRNLFADHVCSEHSPKKPVTFPHKAGRGFNKSSGVVLAHSTPLAQETKLPPFCIRCGRVEPCQRHRSSLYTEAARAEEIDQLSEGRGRSRHPQRLPHRERKTTSPEQGRPPRHNSPSQPRRAAALTRNRVAHTGDVAQSPPGHDTLPEPKLHSGRMYEELSAGERTNQEGHKTT